MQYQYASSYGGGSMINDNAGEDKWITCKKYRIFLKKEKMLFVKN